MNFADLGLSEPLLRAIADSGYTEPTPIQAGAIPPVLMMKDIIGIAQTGTGKTASFVLPMIDILAQGRARAMMPRSLILEPTRELAAQVAENFDKYGKNHRLSMALLIGGVQMGDQVKALAKGVDVLIATPGRLMDLFERGKILLNGCSMLVIDEADRMLDMGFIPDIEHICTKLPAQRQTLLFSATMPPPIKKLADRFLTSPKTIEVARPATTAVNIAQHLIRTTERSKREVLVKLIEAERVRSAIIFCNRKTTVRELNKALRQAGYRSGEIHGDIDQNTRNAELQRFKDGDIDLLVASDVAARGLHVEGISHVFNYDAPWHPDDYVHRIGRTGRAGAKGRAFTLVTPADDEAVANILKLTGQNIPSFSVDPAEMRASGQGRERAPDPAPRRSEGRAEGRSETRSDRRSRSAPRPQSGQAGDASDTPPPTPRRDGASAGKTSRPASRSAARASQPPVQQPARTPADPDGPNDGWNGPLPGFLDFKLKS